MSSNALEQFAHAFDHITDPHSKHDTNIPLKGIIVITILGFLAPKK
jgi:hypothetical protein